MSAILSAYDHQSGEEKQLNVLVLDDDRFDRKKIARWAGSAGDCAINVVEAADLNAMVSITQSQRFDLVFVDYCLADGDGVDALGHLFASSANASAYTVMISGIEDAQARETSLSHGCDTFVEKSQLTTTVLHSILAAARNVPTTPRGSRSDNAVMEYWAARARRRHLVGANHHSEKLGNQAPQDRKLEELDLQNVVQMNGSAQDPQGFLSEFLGEDEFLFNWPEPK
jgi:CheY-like chemotaxis protein